jgi:uncharacterized protein YaiL (DUF2058 family)
MGNSFGDQFLKAGLVDKARLEKANKSTSKQQKLKQKQKIGVPDETAEAARQAVAEKAARDRELNRRQKEEREHRAIQAQVRQLIKLNRLPRDDGAVGYNFQDGMAIRKIFISEEVRDRLARGLLAIVRFGDGYEVIPSLVAEKIRQRDTACIVSHAARQQENGEDDPYADYQVPDDLMW